MPFAIKTLSVFIAVHEDGEEGVLAFKSASNVMMPMVCADQTREDQLRPVAEAICKANKQKCVLTRFSAREDLEEMDFREPA